eukprot:CAMPEP_0177750894 /NCGR_PEP_ID=MMETSP0491_2-20121128/82_1 /TAXON_ID=63592 /ORGANISM="Tetraselmis chuii, Strain PLY429" /LENGTH=85 /DNA_ID=CAMNT_0019265967 /DNA_START=249 /DNA_END=506 /DNA_ORIENTATION=-
MEAGNQQLYRFPVNVSLSRFLLTLGLSMLLAAQRNEVKEVASLQRGLYTCAFALLGLWAVMATRKHFNRRRAKARAANKGSAKAD